MSDRLQGFEERIQQVMQSWQVPGAAVAVLHGDDLRLMQGFGLRDVASEAPVTPDTVFPIASMTKPFTAMGAALLVDDGVLEWDTPIRDYLPIFQMHDAYASQHATLRDLLSHRSGLPRHDLVWYKTESTRRELIANLRYLQSSATLRERWQYNNLMYMTVGYLTGQVAGYENWEAFLRTRILATLGMYNTYPTYAAMRDSAEERATPYMRSRRSGEVTPTDYYTSAVVGPAGAIHSSLSDLTTWLRVHLHGGEAAHTRLVSETNLKEMHTPHIVMPSGQDAALFGTTRLRAYGLGWFIESYRGTTLLHHGGNINGFSLMGAIIPDEQLGVLVLTNLNGTPARDVLLYEAIDRALGLPAQDWDARFHALFDPMLASMNQADETRQQDRIANAPHAHPLSTYAGTYAADGYAPAQVELRDGVLMLNFAGDWLPLLHQHYETFLLELPLFEQTIPVRFSTNDRGEVDGLLARVEPSVDAVLFKRQPLELAEDLLWALDGVYDLPMAGVTVTIRSRAHAVTAAFTGGSETELQPIKREGNLLLFVIKDQPEAVFEFIGEDAPPEAESDIPVFNLLRFKQVNQVFECPRRPDPAEA